MPYKLIGEVGQRIARAKIRLRITRGRLSDRDYEIISSRLKDENKGEDNVRKYNRVALLSLDNKIRVIILQFSG